MSSDGSLLENPASATIYARYRAKLHVEAWRLICRRAEERLLVSFRNADDREVELRGSPAVEPGVLDRWNRCVHSNFVEIDATRLCNAERHIYTVDQHLTRARTRRRREHRRCADSRDLRLRWLRSEAVKRRKSANHKHKFIETVHILRPPDLLT